MAGMLLRDAKFEDAVGAYRAILANHPEGTDGINGLALAVVQQAKFGEAEPLMRRALEIDEASFGFYHPKVAIRFNNLAQLLQATTRLSEAEPLMCRALEIDEASFGSDHPNVARDLSPNCCRPQTASAKRSL